MEKPVEVAIAGGGIMGSAIAYFLTRDPAFRGQVLVVERDPSYANCSTTRSWGGLRQQFSLPENIVMGRYAADFVKSAKDHLSVDGETLDLGFKEQGYLFLASAAGEAQLRQNHARQVAAQSDIAWLKPDEIVARFPWLNVADVAAGCLGLSDEGWLDPASLLQAFRNKAKAQGALYLTDEVEDIERQGRRVTGLTLVSGQQVSCQNVVIAAGPQSGALAALAGVQLPVSPRKRMSFVFDCRAFQEQPELFQAPLTIDTSGMAFRPEGKHFIAILSPPDDQDPDCPDLELDYGPFEDVIWPTLAHRVPLFEAIKLVSAWAGHYDFNSFDHNAILGGHPEIQGLYFCTGFSGHGIQQSPAAGRAISELLTSGAYQTLDLSAFGIERLLEDRPMWESNIV